MSHKYFIYITSAFAILLLTAFIWSNQASAKMSTDQINETPAQAQNLKLAQAAPMMIEDKLQYQAAVIPTSACDNVKTTGVNASQAGNPMGALDGAHAAATLSNAVEGALLAHTQITMHRSCS